MNEPKKRGRPTNAELAAKAALAESMRLDPPVVPVINGDTSREPEDVLQRAQAYALKVWSGQSVDLGRAQRVERVKKALEGQGMPFDGVRLPGDSRDDTEWDDADMQPVSWRKN
jgi:hypothetical protein